jgi:hypothetical protein
MCWGKRGTTHIFLPCRNGADKDNGSPDTDPFHLFHSSGLVTTYEPDVKAADLWRALKRSAWV